MGVSVFDVSARAATAARKMALRTGRNEIALHVSDLPSGACFLRAKASGVTQTLKFILSK
jgi:hypothetical protein